MTQFTAPVMSWKLCCPSNLVWNAIAYPHPRSNVVENHKHYMHTYKNLDDFPGMLRLRGHRNYRLYQNSVKFIKKTT